MTAISVRPLATTISRLQMLGPELAPEFAPELAPGWQSVATICADMPHLDAVVAHSACAYPGCEQRVAAAFFINLYTWYVIAPAVAGYLTERRVPDLAPQQVAVQQAVRHWEYNGASGTSARFGVRLLSGRFACLPDDPAATHPDAIILPDDATLLEWLRVMVEEHLSVMIDAVHARTRLGKRAQWNLAADALLALFDTIGQQIGQPERARACSLAVLKVAGSPLCNPGTGYVTVSCGDQCGTFRSRGGCCLFYRTENGCNCTTCPLRPEAERVALLREQLTASRVA